MSRFTISEDGKTVCGLETRLEWRRRKLRGYSGKAFLTVLEALQSGRIKMADIYAMTKEEFKTRWESNDTGGGVTFDDVAACAIRWGIFKSPKIADMDTVLYRVLKAADVSGAEDYNPENDVEESP